MPHKAIVPQFDPDSDTRVSNVTIDLGDHFSTTEEAAASIQDQGYSEGYVFDAKDSPEVFGLLDRGFEPADEHVVKLETLS